MRFSEVAVLAMEDISADPEISESVRLRALEGKCLIEQCECESCKRGLCQRHYEMFARTKRDTPVRERRAFEEKMIRRGLILAPGAIRALTADNPFATAE